MTTTVMLNQDQEEIREVARSFLRARFPSDRIRELIAAEDDFDRACWEEIAALGWLGIAVPEERGGAGYSIVERCLLLEEMGRVLAPAAFLTSAALATDALVAVAAEEPAADLLAGILDGSVRATLVAAGDLLGSAAPSGGVAAAADGASVDGPGGLVPDGAGAELLIVVATLADGGLGLFAVEAGGDGVQRSPAATVDETRGAASIVFEGAPARRLDAGGDNRAAIAELLDRGAISIAAEQVGGAQQAIDMTLTYMNERHQFGRPIGSFQALKHRLADLFVTIDAAREGVYAAADVAAERRLEQLPMAAAVAKQAASDGYLKVAGEAIQMHGGIGFTEEHDIGLHYKRAAVSAATLGTSRAQIERIAAGLGV